MKSAKDIFHEEREREITKEKGNRIIFVQAPPTTSTSVVSLTASSGNSNQQDKPPF